MGHWFRTPGLALALVVSRRQGINSQPGIQIVHMIEKENRLSSQFGKVN